MVEVTHAYTPKQQKSDEKAILLKVINCQSGGKKGTGATLLRIGDHSYFY